MSELAPQVMTNVSYWATNQALNSGAPLANYFWAGFGFFWVAFLIAWAIVFIRNIIVGGGVGEG